MIEITTGTIEEQIIKFLRKNYPATVRDLEKKLHVSRDNIIRTLQKFQIKGVLQLEPLPDKIFIRLKRNDFKFIGKKRQKKFVKHKANPKKYQSEDYDGVMYS